MLREEGGRLQIRILMLGLGILSETPIWATEVGPVCNLASKLRPDSTQEGRRQIPRFPLGLSR